MWLLRIKVQMQKGSKFHGSQRCPTSASPSRAGQDLVPLTEGSRVAVVSQTPMRYVYVIDICHNSLICHNYSKNPTKEWRATASPMRHMCYTHVSQYPDML